MKSKKSSVATKSDQRFVFKSRKAERKAMRQMKKQKKKQLPQVAESEIAVVKVNKKKKPPAVPSTVDWRVADRNKEKLEEMKLQRQYDKSRREQMKEANVYEDKEIKRLAKHLKIDKRKTVGKSFVEDGLDYLLDVCDPETRKDCATLKESLLDLESNFQEDYNTVNDLKRKKKTAESEVKEKKKKVTFDVDEDSSNEDTFEYEHEDDDISDNDDDDEDVSDYEIHDGFDLENEENSDEETYECDREEEFDYSDDDNGVDDDDGEDNDVNDDKIKNKSTEVDKNLKEDIYGRIKKPDGTVVEKSSVYVPPHLRKSDDSEQLKRLRQQVKGLLNRLAETNMHSISRQIEDVYQVNSRNNMNETLYNCIYELVVQSQCITPYRIVVESSTLITILHTNVGSEIGAFFLQSLATKLNTLNESNSLKVEDKEIDNVLLLLCCLYAFKVFNSGLIFEILEKFLAKFEEKQIDLILTVLRTVGFNLRKDNPMAIKKLLLDIQKKNTEVCKSTDNSRVKFMLEILLAIKNNNINKIPTGSEQCYATYIEHIQKMIRTFFRYNKTPAELAITLDDLLNVDNKGRWWIVGSAWKGDEQSAKNILKKTTDTYDKKLLELAKKYRMNTDTRKNIFCILFTAEDYLDAFNKLVRLGLKGPQQEEIVSVLVHCLLVYKTYNPFFALVAQQLCESDRKYQAFLKRSINVRMEEINSLKKHQLPILASFLAQLLRDNSLPITLLKNVDWGSLNKLMVSFVRQTLIKVLQDSNDEETTTIFVKASKNPGLQFFREGLSLFLSHFLIKNSAQDVSDDKLKLLTKRVKTAQAALNSG
ncbi:nucleolar MIF4G domain-containing protein 1 [Adelges cooleyi]|uniref:nucleolar MIF4G domain-containing protein 1 n=1 Tax=Adelges cooleyi TaxID=133065 RepID=UPI00217F94FF|nr:nucleolar MIF4G domain-containing protein 1 [Adelges cooleyi]XP_050425316.1 nucleolar MIF4G domain-containing protein 1 [Adelges cooleyi]